MTHTRFPRPKPHVVPSLRDVPQITTATYEALYHGREPSPEEQAENALAIEKACEALRKHNGFCPFPLR
jgi:hypothetical protein